MPFGFKAVSFRFVPFHVVSPLMPKARVIMRAKSGRGVAVVATVQLEALKAIAFEASVQPRDTSPSLLSMLERNRTKRNGKRRFLRIVRAVAVLFLWLLVKPNGIVILETFF